MQRILKVFGKNYTHDYVGWWYFNLLYIWGETRATIPISIARLEYNELNAKLICASVLMKVGKNG